MAQRTQCPHLPQSQGAPATDVGEMQQTHLGGCRDAENKSAAHAQHSRVFRAPGEAPFQGERDVFQMR